MRTLFFSYSHVDENLRNQLETHLSGLQRQGVISSWHDRRITAGTDFDRAINDHLRTSDVILLLISPDFIASDYCFEREMSLALERHKSGEARVIPVILRPCDWRDLPFGRLLASPTDGRPITMWPNIDQAFLDVVTAIKEAMKEMGLSPEPASPGRIGPMSASTGGSLQTGARSSNLRIKKKFTELDKDRFRHEGFEYIAKFFENSLKELVKRNPGLDQTFLRIDATRFSAAAYREGVKVCKGSISVGRGVMSAGGIEYVMTDEPSGGGMNEAVYVKTDDQAIYFEALGMQSYGRDREKLTFEGAAELFWDIFIRPLQ